jgi:hypothetical protein
MTGQVDFGGHAGRATVNATGGADAAVTDVVWDATTVIERIPALSELAATLGTEAADWYARPPDVDGRALDAMVALITALAAERRDNPVLLVQTPGTAWLGADVIPNTGIEVDVLRYGDDTVYWIERGGVTLFRFEGDNAMGTRPVVVDLRDHGPRKIEFPPADRVVPTALVAELYDAVVNAPAR